MCDQGGERIDILKERTATLRAEAHHQPCVLENHPADSRLQISENGKVQTLTSRCGTGGGNALDKSRLRERMGRLDEPAMHQVDNAIAVSFGLPQ